MFHPHNRNNYLRIAFSPDPDWKEGDRAGNDRVPRGRMLARSFREAT